MSIDQLIKIFVPDIVKFHAIPQPKGVRMNILAGLMADIESGLHISSLSSVFSSVASVLELMEENYLHDQNAKNAAIDTVIALLQKLKS